ncbi:MAG: DPP IV N-terminal domain-containing protein, partial [Saprospiraceae bacterium]
LLTPGLCWSPNGRKIAISVKSGSKDAMYIFDVESEDYYELPLKFEGIFCANWNPKNNSIVFVGDNSKQSDIFVYDLTSKKLIQITNDLFSDIYPSWSSDGSKIYFTSDRGDYTDLRNVPSGLKMINYEFGDRDLYTYEMSTGTLEHFIKEKNSDEVNVVSSPDGKKILYISDRNGIDNIYLRNLETNEDRPITNSISGIELLSLSEDGTRLSFRALHKGGYDIFYIENPFDVNLNMTELPKTIFMENELKKLNLKSANLDSNEITKQDSSYTDSLKIIVNYIKDTNGVVRDTSNLYGNDIALNLNTGTDDTLNSKKIGVKLKEPSKFKIIGNVNDDGTFKVNKYKIKFSPDIIFSNVNYSSFYGVQGQAQLSFSDVLGNHRIYVATSLVLDLKNSDYAFAYYYLPKRIDYGFEAFHSARFLLIEKQDTSLNLYRYRNYGLNLNASMPISKFNRIDAALSFSQLSKENLDDPNEPIQRLYTALPILSYVHDNTLFGYTAPVRGTRYNLTAYGTPKLGKSGAEFFTATGDYRTYFKFAEDFNFVLRLNGGLSVGRNPQKFYLGGTPNWINYTIQNNAYPIEDIQDFAFATPVTPLRGFNYNQVTGTKFALMNAEFRFPLFRYLVFGPLPFAFQNIQGVLFTDIGTAWTNNKQLQLFQKDANGSLRTKDLLIGMGIGARMYLLYFPFKFDVAWSYDMKKFS